MIFLLAGVLLITVWRMIALRRHLGLASVLRGVAIAACAGILAGVFIGLGARIGMRAITVANGAPHRFTTSGTFTVVVSFSSLGIVLGVVYEVLFRRLLRRNGLAYGGLLTVCTWYPLAHAATQQLTVSRTLIPLVTLSGLFIALMWLPFGVSLEALLRKWGTEGVCR